MPLPRRVPQKIDLKPKKHHGFFFLIWFLGFLVPPLGGCFSLPRVYVNRC